MKVIFCGINPLDLSGHKVARVDEVRELDEQQADIVVVSDAVPGWHNINNKDDCYLVSEELSLELLEEAENSGYAGVWTLSEFPVRLTAVLGRLEPGEVRQMRRSLERAVPSPERSVAAEPEHEERNVQRNRLYQGERHREDSFYGHGERKPEEMDFYRSQPARKKPVANPFAEKQLVPQQYVPRQIIAFNSAGGGKGKSVITSAVGVMLSMDQRFQASVVAVDLDPYAGTLARKLGVTPRYTILDWISGAVDDITRCLVPVPLPGSGDNTLMVLSGPEREEDGGALTEDVVQNLLTTLQRRFDIVLVDTKPELADATLVALEYAQNIFLIDVPDATSLRNTHKRVSTLADLGMLQKTHLVINRVPKKPVMRMDVVEAIPSASEIIYLPEDPGVQVAINRLEPVGLGRRAKKFTGAMSDVLKKIVPNYVEPKEKRNFLNIFRRNKGVAL